MIQLIKLSNGQDIIGDIVTSEEGAIFVDEPLTIIYTQKNPSSPPIIYLQRYMPFAKHSTMFIRNEHVVSVAYPLKSMEAYYRRSLKNIQMHVDPMLDQELSIASGEDEMSEESKSKLAYVEKEITKPTLN
jgi:hypothetical protein